MYNFFSPCATLCDLNPNTILSTIFPYALFLDVVSVYVLHYLQTLPVVNMHNEQLTSDFSSSTSYSSVIPCD